MKHLIFLFTLMLISFEASAINCSYEGVENKLDIKWIAPTFREVNGNGVEESLDPAMIAGYTIQWFDIDAENGNNCSVFISIPTAVGAPLNLEPGINYKINILTVDTGNRSSSPSEDILVTTTGVPIEPPPSQSPPQPPSNPRVTTY